MSEESGLFSFKWGGGGYFEPKILNSNGKSKKRYFLKKVGILKDFEYQWP